MSGRPYTFDTQGHEVFFDNDIAERKWKDRYRHQDFQTTGARDKRTRLLANLPLGLCKVGKGSLTLTGDNAFTGHVAVAESVAPFAPRYHQILMVALLECR